MLIDQEDGSHAGHGHNEYDDDDDVTAKGWVFAGWRILRHWR